VGPRAGPDRCGKSRPHRVSIPDCPPCSQSLYRLSYPAHNKIIGAEKIEVNNINLVSSSVKWEVLLGWVQIESVLQGRQ